MEKMFRLYYSDSVQKYDNCIYPHEIEITDEKSLIAATSFDYVCVKYQGNRRNNSNFISSNCIAFDFDNDHSDNEEDWIKPEDIKNLFVDVPYLVHYSKSHMKDKSGISPRPRFHIIFPIDECTSADEYRNLKLKVHEYLPLVDKNALDSARFMAGTKDPKVEIHNEGNTTLNKFIDYVFESKDRFEEFDNKPKEISQGSRNDTMHKAAVRLLKRYGNNNDTKRKFLEEAKRCNPPLEIPELKTIWFSAAKFFKEKIEVSSAYVKPEEYSNKSDVLWDEPISFNKVELPSFPVDALPSSIAPYVIAVSETTQTPVDMAATASLAVLSLCIQGRYHIQAKPDWTEPVNLYTLIIAEPSERKSAIIGLMTYPILDYEKEYNERNSASFEFSHMIKMSLENKKKSFETQYAKGKATKEQLMEIAKEIADFKEMIPKKLFVDNITTEKLTSVISNNNGKTAIISSEGGIFDILAGMYSNQGVNIDVFLKAYSGDSVRVDRTGRPSELISNPCLTILLSVQPSVLMNFMSNGTFEGKGLTTRFLYTFPSSLIGSRKYHTSPIPNEARIMYENKIKELLLEDEDISCTGVTIHLSKEASALLEEYFNENEKEMVSDNKEIKYWSGKLVGNVLRIAAILCRAEYGKIEFFLNDDVKLLVTEDQMARAIKLGRYFTEHSKAVHSLAGLDSISKECDYVLEKIKSNGLSEFTKRELIRMCRSFKNSNDLSPVLAKLTEFGYIQPKIEKGKQSTTSFLVNPYIYGGNKKTGGNNNEKK